MLVRRDRWPFSLAGRSQLLAADLYAGRDPTLGDLLSRAKPLWTRMFVLGLIVYGSYFLWTVDPTPRGAFAGGRRDLGERVLSCSSLLFFRPGCSARLFINFLFWQQAGRAWRDGGTRGSAGKQGSGAKRYGPAPVQRPLYRGAMIVALWLLVIIAANVAILLPVVLFRMRGVTSLGAGRHDGAGDGDDEFPRFTFRPNDAS